MTRVTFRPTVDVSVEGAQSELAFYRAVTKVTAWLAGLATLSCGGRKPKKESHVSNDSQNVRVTDIRMPFGSMVAFMVKWAIASIPALIILTVLGVLFWAAILAITGHAH